MPRLLFVVFQYATKAQHVSPTMQVVAETDKSGT
jgi:hypothetical protein